jgi:hypothetical protein
MQFATLFSSSIINTIKMYILMSSLQLLDAVLPSHSWDGFVAGCLIDHDFKKMKKKSSNASCSLVLCSTIQIKCV